jgi:hypothetical protein
MKIVMMEHHIPFDAEDSDALKRAISGEPDEQELLELAQNALNMYAHFDANKETEFPRYLDTHKQLQRIAGLAGDLQREIDALNIDAHTAIEYRVFIRDSRYQTEGGRPLVLRLEALAPALKEMAEVATKEADRFSGLAHKDKGRGGPKHKDWAAHLTVEFLATHLGDRRRLVTPLARAVMKAGGRKGGVDGGDGIVAKVLKNMDAPDKDAPKA